MEIRHATAIGRETRDRRRKPRGRGDSVIDKRCCMTAAAMAMQQQTGDGRPHAASRARQLPVIAENAAATLFRVAAT